MSDEKQGCHGYVRLECRYKWSCAHDRQDYVPRKGTACPTLECCPTIGPANGFIRGRDLTRACMIFLHHVLRFGEAYRGLAKSGMQLYPVLLL